MKNNKDQEAKKEENINNETTDKKVEKDIKKEKTKKEKKDKKEKKSKKDEKKGKKENKFIQIIKKKLLVNGTITFLLVALIIAVFIGIIVGVKKANIKPIDLTEEKIYTLTNESKEQIKNIDLGDTQLNIYFVGIQEGDSTLDLARQYTKINDKISVQLVDTTSRPDLVQKYGLDSSTSAIILEYGEKFKILSMDELYTYDSNYKQINIAEEKITAAIKTVTSEKVPKVYFLNGYSDITLTSGMQYLNVYLSNEVNEVSTLNVLSEGKIPDDCDTLVITTPNKDFDEIATKAITDYINKGGNILWLNAAVAKETNYENVNKILAMYGVKPFSVGVIRETDSNKMVSGYPEIIIPEIEYSKITKRLYGLNNVILVTATKINLVSDDELTAQNITKTDLVKSSEKSYFRTDLKLQSNNPIDGEETGELLIGAELDKVIVAKNEETGANEIKSKLVIYGENLFASDATLTQETQKPIITYGQNKDLVLNTIAYLTDREEDITVRKTKESVTYSPTKKENTIILTIILVVPIAIIALGIVIWQVRKRKK